jgi:hypothetical protein
MTDVSGRPVMNADQIDAEHDRLGMNLGWRFLMCPEARLKDAKVAIITLNPGGTRRVDTEWSQEHGNAYYIEGWGGRAPGQHKLQVQVQALVKAIGEDKDSVLAGCFIPFRSKDYRALPRPAECIQFARRLWGSVLEESPARLFVCVGKNVVGKGLAGLIGARPLSSVPLPWGGMPITIDRYQAADGRAVVAFPHFSHFPPFSRPERTKAAVDAIRGVWSRTIET